ncbi:hypothetical protein TWF481_003992 [Arthrobotrys musiformis]|uniref:Uncharacterized protein n=1 Tax=Arthrobotrys musiformis TaxID=47236 RepID=A0AAV9WJH3_9PEZI
MGTTHSVYMANDSRQDIYLMVSLNPDWAIVDVIADVILLFNGVEEIKAACTTLDLPAALKTLKDLYDFLKIASMVVGGMFATGSRQADALLSFIEAFKKTSHKLEYNESVEIHSDNFLNYLNADGIAALAGAETVSVIAMSGDSKQLAFWNTNSDASWIATDVRRIVRSKYGTIWTQNPSAGEIIWPNVSRPFPWGDKSDRITAGNAYIVSIKDTNKVLMPVGPRVLVEPFDPKYQEQYWKCTSDTDSNVGLLNSGTHSFMGKKDIDGGWYMACVASKQRGWECLTLLPQTKEVYVENPTRARGDIIDDSFHYTVLLGYKLCVKMDDRTCPTVLRLSSFYGDRMEVVDESDTLIQLRAV